MPVIYLKGEHGTRIAINEQEAQAHEKDGYVRYDPYEAQVSVDAPPAAAPEVESPPPKKRGRRKKAD